MPSYVLAFRARPGRTLTAEEEARWPEWFTQIGASITERGHRVGQARSVGHDGGHDYALSGYIVVTAANFDAAAAIAQGCPILQQDGSVEVGEIVPA
jgi:hypothetical protein